ncbi:MAG: M48 family metallopeptidase [Planctomycetota bacterium]|nr:M48 family metallopeptidase [Planctomycetota bacterium]
MSMLRLDSTAAIRLLALTLAAWFVVSLAACTTNPTTGKSQFNALSRADEIALGEQATPDMTKEYGGKVPSPELQAYVTEVGMKMARLTEGDYPSLPWEFTLLDSDVINAFALPGGKVFITRGICSKMTNEAQLAGVLGHEIGHVTARHINDRYTDSLLVGIGAAVAGAAAERVLDKDTGGMVPALAGAGGSLIMLKFGRDQESESDSLGLRYMTKAGYDPIGQLQVMHLLDREAGSGGQPEILASHPLPKTRIDRVQRLIDTDFAFARGKPGFTTGEQQFKDRFLNKLAALKPPPKK